MRIELQTRHLVSDATRGLVVGLARQLVGAPMYPDEVPSADITRCMQRLLRRHVHGLRDDARRVGPDGQRGEVEGAEELPDHLEVRGVAAVTAEVEALRSDH